MSSASAPQNTSEPASPDKGKGKLKPADAMDEDDVDVDDDDDDDDEEEEEEEEEDPEHMDDEDEDEFAEIDPAAILPPGRRTRGVKVDYSSAAAHEKAGLHDAPAEGDDADDSFVAQDAPKAH